MSLPDNHEHGPTTGLRELRIETRGDHALDELRPLSSMSELRQIMVDTFAPRGARGGTGLMLSPAALPFSIAYRVTAPASFSVPGTSAAASFSPKSLDRGLVVFRAKDVRMRATRPLV